MDVSGRSLVPLLLCPSFSKDLPTVRLRLSKWELHELCRASCGFCVSAPDSQAEGPMVGAVDTCITFDSRGTSIYLVAFIYLH